MIGAPVNALLINSAVWLPARKVHDNRWHLSRMEKETDESILQRIAADDDAAFAALYDRFSGRLYALALRILEDEQDARDALQEGFLYLWEKASNFDPTKSKAYTWSVMIFRHKAIDRLRSRRRRLKLADDAANDLIEIDRFNPETGDELAAKADDAAAVRRAMKSLPEEQRKSIEWAFFRGFTHHQLAEFFGQPLGTVKTNIRRGLLRLRDAMRGGES